MEINRAEVVAEVSAAYHRYETALLQADATTLDELFWADARTIRYGADEILYGHDAIAAFNKRRRLNPERRLVKTVLTTYGDNFATVSTLFADVPEGMIGRQMQSWARMADGWRVVAAHVSVIDRPNEIGQ
ncbi:oxalurate catabolism protein HpxZ [Lichenihabitans sp. Uapishka_5]|uniref:oxalurate catabolism protein HpxZ n=1 Tax=Lichenihabitans sp. Uapishka_5 TaxID=3037302 RepID=UPI0029E8117D|nr:oxalurate catabolism protein HpxZ [Lichenihabitans sp. Uapishka_5]MDX7951307.1 oxalurate catabolism protein HpxZ [Lichenihabitans sp. Uapishka_5]